MSEVPLVSEHAHGSLGITRGHFARHFACLFSFVEVRTAKFECSRQRLCVDGDIFENAPREDADIFLYG